MTSNEPKRGEIWRVQFDPTRGDEIQKTRPAIVISADGLSGMNNITIQNFDDDLKNGLQKRAKYYGLVIQLLLF